MQEAQRWEPRLDTSLIQGAEGPKPKTTNSWFGAFSVINSMIGAGILVLPTATENMGLLMSKQIASSTAVIVVMSIVAFMNVVACDLLLHAIELTQQL